MREEELVADLVGDYLFTDSEFINRLYTGNRNAFEKALDEIKYFCRVVTAGSKEAKQLEKVKKAFENAYRQDAKNTADDGGVRYSLVGRTASGEGIYKTNYPDGTPKSVKQADLIEIVQNVWSKKPIELTIVEDGEYKKINVKFNGELSERSDLGKIAFGNKKGNGSEKRMTLDLASDLYQIAQESRFNYSKDAIPKPDNPAHDGVTKYHYFITNIVYKNNAGEYTPCHMTIDVKRNGEGNWFYSFGIEKGSAPQTLLAAVTDDSATLPNTKIASETEIVNPKLSISSQEDLFPVRKDLRPGRIYGSDVELAPVRQDVQAQVETEEQGEYDDLPFEMPEGIEQGQLTDEELEEDAKRRPVETVAQRLEVKFASLRQELRENEQQRQVSNDAYERKIEELQQRYEAKPNKHTKAANAIARQISRQKQLQKQRDAEFEKRIHDIQKKIDNTRKLIQWDHSREDLLEKQLRQVDEKTLPISKKSKRNGKSLIFDQFSCNILRIEER